MALYFGLPRVLIQYPACLLPSQLCVSLLPDAVVSDGLLMILLDVTSSLTGPRLRDRLSHGEIQLDAVPRWLANFVFCVALVTTQSFHHEVCLSLILIQFSILCLG